MSKDLIHYKNKDGRECWHEKVSFVRKAMVHALRYDDKELLLIAVDHELPQLWALPNASLLLSKIIQHHEPELKQSDYSKETLMHLIQQRGFKRKGHKPNQNKINDRRESDLWPLVHYWNGRGLMIWNEAEPEKSAIGKAAEAVHLSPTQVKKIFYSIKKREERDWALQIMRKTAFLQGKAEKGQVL